jgi:hypothetical protein
MAGACKGLGADDITRLQRFSDLPGQLGLVGGPGPDAGDAGRVPPMLGKPLRAPQDMTQFSLGHRSASRRIAE